MKRKKPYVPNQSTRSGKWYKVWLRKGEGRAQELHILNGYNHITTEQYSNMVKTLLDPLGLTESDSVLDCGCGAGAFLSVINRIYGVVNLCGIDYSTSLLNNARSHLDGEFFCGDITSMSWLKDDSFDNAVCFSVFHYLDDADAVLLSVKEMIRVVRPGGKVFIGDINDKAKEELMHKLRETTHASAENTRKHVASNTGMEHLTLQQSFFTSRAAELGVNMFIKNHDALKFSSYYPCSPYRFSVYMEVLKK